MKKIFYFIFVVITSCSNAGQDCSKREFDFGNQKYFAEGCLIDNIENGSWNFYNETEKLISNGIYDRGIRIGRWHYPGNFNDSIIEWEKYESKNLGLIFNIPSALYLVNDTLSDVQFSNKDSSKPFVIALSVLELEEANKDLENYYELGEREIKQNGWDFSRQSNQIITKNHKLYLNSYSIRIDSGQSFKVLNIYRLMGDKIFFEISCRYDERTESSAKIVFFSAVANCFYKGERVINPFEPIKYIKTK